MSKRALWCFICFGLALAAYSPVSAIAVDFGPFTLLTVSGGLTSITPRVAVKFRGETLLEDTPIAFSDSGSRNLLFKENEVEVTTSSNAISIRATSILGRFTAVYRMSRDRVMIKKEWAAAADQGIAAIFSETFFSKQFFSNASITSERAGTIRFAPETMVNWTDQSRKVDIETGNARWNITMNSASGAGCLFRTATHQAWRPEKEKTLEALYLVQAMSNSSDSLTVDFSMRPKPGSEGLLDVFAGDQERSREYFASVLKKYNVDASLSGDAMTLAKQVCEVSAGLDETRLDPKRNIILPQPRSVEAGSRVFVAGPIVTVSCATDHAAARELLEQELWRYRMKAAYVAPDASPQITIGVATEPVIRDICSRVGLDVGDEGPEGYVIKVTPTKILIAGNDASGVVYGMQTLRQMIRPGRNGLSIREVTVKDHPDIKSRGFYLEGGGYYADSDDVKRLIRNTHSFAKANLLICEIMWNGFAWKSRPEIARSNALPVSALAAVANEARKYGLEFVPVVHAVGRCAEILDSHPEIAENADWKKSRYDAAACIRNPLTYQIHFDMLEEIIAATQCKRLHISHDELKNIGVCPKCSAEDPAELFASSVNTFADWLAARGVKTLIWGDALLENKYWVKLGVSSANSGGNYSTKITHPALDKIRKDIIICDWHYREVDGFPTFKYFTDKGFSVIGIAWHNNANNAAMVRAVSAHSTPRMLGMLTADYGLLATRLPIFTSLVGPMYSWNTKMEEMKDIGWDPQAVLAASILDPLRPSRRMGARFSPVNMDASGNKPMTGTGAWFNFGERSDLSFLPEGTVTLFGTPYRIGKRCVVVGKEDRENGVLSRQTIVMNGKAESIIFLHALQVVMPSIWSRVCGSYVVKYSDGSSASATINSQNICHWLPKEPRMNPWGEGGGRYDYGYTWRSVNAWEGCTKNGEPAGLQAFEWRNPNPDKTIASIEMSAMQNVPGLQLGLAAITMVE